jgi:thymidylate kinase
MNGKLISIEGIDGSGKSTILKRIKRRWGEEGFSEDVIFTAEPTDFAIGKKARELSDTDIDPFSLAFLFLADHAEHLSKLIKPALAEGKDVITDRYIDSRYAYQGVTLKKYFCPDDFVVVLTPSGWDADESLIRRRENQRFSHAKTRRVFSRSQKSSIFEDEKDPIKWLKKIHEPFSVVPDRTILLVTDVDVAVERISRKDGKRTKLGDKDFSNQRFEIHKAKICDFLKKVQRNYLELADDEKERFIEIDANAELDFVERAVERELNKILSFSEEDG